MFVFVFFFLYGFCVRFGLHLISMLCFYFILFLLYSSFLVIPRMMLFDGDALFIFGMPFKTACSPDSNHLYIWMAVCVQPKMPINRLALCTKSISIERGKLNLNLMFFILRPKCASRTSITINKRRVCF